MDTQNLLCHRALEEPCESCCFFSKGGVGSHSPFGPRLNRYEEVDAYSGASIGDAHRRVAIPFLPMVTLCRPQTQWSSSPSTWRNLHVLYEDRVGDQSESLPWHVL